MKPIAFEEVNKTFVGPKEMPDCQDLRVYQDNEQIISCWELSAADKASALFFGKVWLRVYGSNHPPVWLSTDNTVFRKENESEDWKEKQNAAIELFLKRKVQQFISQESFCMADFPYGIEGTLEDFIKFALNIEPKEETVANSD